MVSRTYECLISYIQVKLLNFLLLLTLIFETLYKFFCENVFYFTYLKLQKKFVTYNLEFFGIFLWIFHFLYSIMIKYKIIFINITFSKNIYIYIYIYGYIWSLIILVSNYHRNKYTRMSFLSFIHFLLSETLYMLIV